ncbi:MAG: type II toxin-antitoxin system HicB family antitoxin [bacterium]
MIEVYKDKDETYIASCPKLEVYSYGHTLDKAVARLKEVVNFYMESARELGVSLEELCIGHKGSNIPQERYSSLLKNREHLH